MSIIEKALSKQKEARRGNGGAAPADPTEPPPEQGRAAGASSVERAMGRAGSVKRDADPAPRAGLFPQVGPGKAEQESSQPSGAVTQREVSISRQHLQRIGLLNPDGERSQVAEEFRLIKRPLLANAFAVGEDAIEHGNLVMVTSSLPREGKSFCTLNLALSIAMEFDRTVLLVDADVARPSVLHYLGIRESGPGLLDILADENTDFPDALIRTDIDKLTILPAGHTYPRANEMLASNAMRDLVKEMSNRYPDRVILFDTPPLLATSEASVLAQHMGQIVFVVEAEKTPQDATVRAVEQLEGCDVVLPLLNKSKPLPGRRYAQGYYGSYYREGT